MKLSEWMSKKRLSNSEVAKIITERTGVSVERTYVSRLKNGHRKPSMSMAQAIKEASGGRVSMNDWA